MDIAFGLLRADDGALAKSWFKWRTQKLGYAEDALDQDLAHKVQNNLKTL